MRSFLKGKANEARRALAERQDAKEVARRARWRERVIEGDVPVAQACEEAVPPPVAFLAFDAWKAAFEPPLGARAGVDSHIERAGDAVLRRALDMVADALAAAAVAGALEAAARALHTAGRGTDGDLAGAINALMGLVCAFHFGGRPGDKVKGETAARGAYLRELAASTLVARLDGLAAAGAGNDVLADALVARLDDASDDATEALRALPVATLAKSALGEAATAAGGQAATDAVDVLLQAARAYLAGAGKALTRRLGAAVRAVLAAYDDDAGGEGAETDAEKRAARAATLLAACEAQHEAAYSTARAVSGAVTGFLGHLAKGGGDRGGGGEEEE